MTVGVLATPGSPLLGYTLRALLEEGVPIGGVLLDSKGVSEKDINIWNERTNNHLPVIELETFADAMIPFYFVESHNSQSAVKLVRKLGLNLLVNGGTPRILKSEILNAAQTGILNIHPGKLPDYRGCTCLEWAVYNNEQVYNTVHYMTEDIDAGKVIMEEPYEFSSSDDYVDVRVKVYLGGFSLLARAANCILKNESLHSHQKFPGKEGRYYKPISDDLLDVVKKKLVSGNYKYQTG
ncbi:MAG: formyltransferase family protein [Chromatiales bacterium]|jgi:methionyl-tRNA formyltransferase